MLKSQVAIAGATSQESDSLISLLRSRFRHFAGVGSSGGGSLQMANIAVRHVDRELAEATSSAYEQAGRAG